MRAATQQDEEHELHECPFLRKFTKLEAKVYELDRDGKVGHRDDGVCPRLELPKAVEIRPHLTEACTLNHA